MHLDTNTNLESLLVCLGTTVPFVIVRALRYGVVQLFVGSNLVDVVAFVVKFGGGKRASHRVRELAAGKVGIRIEDVTYLVYMQLTLSFPLRRRTNADSK